MNKTLTGTVAAGEKIKIAGRGYSIEKDLGVGESMRKMNPDLVGQFAIKGERGAWGILQVYVRGYFRAGLGRSFTQRIEGWIDAAVQS